MRTLAIAICVALSLCIFGLSVLRVAANGSVDAYAFGYALGRACIVPAVVTGWAVFADKITGLRVIGASLVLGVTILFSLGQFVAESATISEDDFGAGCVEGCEESGDLGHEYCAKQCACIAERAFAGKTADERLALLNSPGFPDEVKSIASECAAASAD